MPNNRPPLYPPPIPPPAPRRRSNASRRRADAAERENERWAAKYAKAVTPAQKAAVDFDRVRAAIRDLERRDPARAAAYWLELSAILGRLCDATRRDATRRRAKAPLTASMRGRAREATGCLGHRPRRVASREH